MPGGTTHSTRSWLQSSKEELPWAEKCQPLMASSQRTIKKPLLPIFRVNGTSGSMRHGLKGVGSDWCCAGRQQSWPFHYAYQNRMLDPGTGPATQDEVELQQRRSGQGQPVSCRFTSCPMGFHATDNGAGCKMDVSCMVYSESQTKRHRGIEVNYIPMINIISSRLSFKETVDYGFCSDVLYLFNYDCDAYYFLIFFPGD